VSEEELALMEMEIEEEASRHNDDHCSCDLCDEGWPYPDVDHGPLDLNLFDARGHMVSMA